MGKALIESKLVDSVHMTGSDKTYDAIVWQGRPKARASTQLFHDQRHLFSSPPPRWRFLAAVASPQKGSDPDRCMRVTAVP